MSGNKVDIWCDKRHWDTLGDFLARKGEGINGLRMTISDCMTHLEDTSEACLSSSAVSLTLKDFFGCDCEPLTEVNGGCELASAGKVSGGATADDVAEGTLGATVDRGQGADTGSGVPFEAKTG